MNKILESRAKRSKRSTERLFESKGKRKRKRSGAVLKKKFNWWRLFSNIANFFRLLLLIGTVFVLVLSPFVAWNYLSNNAVFKIERVLVFGDIKYLNKDDLERLTNVALGQNFIGFDVGSFQRHLQKEAWVKTAQVKRQWFDELEVSIEEERPVARWNSVDLIDKDGKIFRPERLPEEPIPNLVGSEDYRELLLEKMSYIRPRLNNLGLDADTIILDERLSWSILLDNKIRVELGTEKFEERFQRFLNHYTTQIAPKVNEIVSIDLRYPNGFATGWKNIEEVK